MEFSAPDDHAGLVRRLEGRGVEDLLHEYATSNDDARVSRLRAFFSLLEPETEPRTRHDTSVLISYRDDFLTLERTKRLFDGGEEVLIVEGSPVEDMPIDLIDIGGSILLPDQTLMIGENYVTEHVRHMSGAWLQSGEGYSLQHLHNLDRHSRSARVRRPLGHVKLSAKPVHFLFQTIIGSASFGHFLHDAMIQLIVFDNLREAHGGNLVPIIVNDLDSPLRYPGMQWLYEGLVGPVSDSVHLHGDACLTVPRGFTSNRLMHIGDGGISFRAVQYLRNRVFTRFLPSPDRLRLKRVYISRKDISSREAENIGDVEKVLQQAGFAEVVIGGMNPQAVFDALYDAEVIVGMHGSGLMNYVYTRGQARVIELAYIGHLWTSILTFAAACGHIPVRVMYDDLGIKLDQLEAALAELPS